MPDFSLEDSLCTNKNNVIIGVDEVGYGAIAGPVVSAAVYITDRNSPCLAAVRDSKKLTARQREAIFQKIETFAIFSVGFASVYEIETSNVLAASHIAMRRAIETLNVPRIDLVLVDGIREPCLSWKSKAIVKGDNLSTSIATASIIAKVTRDRFMAELHTRHPEYLWNKNCGYGTKAHILALSQHGATPHHRRSFAPVKNQSTK
ncbi:MAG: ribonuclease HII [Aaplasma endosymbiont of Hyalomma asiaticum]